MIVDDRGETWTLVTQGDHARLAGEILTLWRADGLPDHPRRNRLIAATRGHDDGWSGADAAPRIDPRHGRPWVFDELPADLRFEIWRQGIEDNAKRDAYRGLLVACHALHLHADRESEPDWAEFLAAIRERRDELAEATEVAVEEVGDEYRLLHLADLISLAAACRWSGPLESSGRRLELDGRTVTVDPFPPGRGDDLPAALPIDPGATLRPRLRAGDRPLQGPLDRGACPPRPFHRNA